MRIQFNIHYDTQPGQNIYVCGTTSLLGEGEAAHAFPLRYIRGGHWSGIVDLPADTGEIEYNYLLKDEQGTVLREWGKARKLLLRKIPGPKLLAFESWRAPAPDEKVMYSSAFSKAILPPNQQAKGKVSRAKKTLMFKIDVPRIGPGQQLCVCGNQEALGNWDLSRPLLLACGNDHPTWTGSVNLSGMNFPLEYKYGIYDLQKKEVTLLERDDNRRIDTAPEEEAVVLLRSDESFRYSLENWRGAGVAVPVFSLRSKKSYGVGDFADLLRFVDWAKGVGMKMVQILPINETIATHNWLDSYPYKSISVMALHPIYMNLEKMGTLKDKKSQANFIKRAKELNAELQVNYPEVLALKSRFYKLLFDQEKATFFKQKDYQEFFRTNREWLVPYAAFAYLRDRMKSPDFRTWGTFSRYDPKAIEKISRPEAEEWDDIAVHYFIQYHLDRQLREVTAHARRQGIVLKGDIPIGISPNSVEAWTEPHLFHLDAQAGAPPDDFAVKGQNWGFPTYNWEAMAKEDYRWWKDRLAKMADYFDAYRIDHILGFFRIWEIPLHAVEGVLGHFNKAMPLTLADIRNYGIRLEPARMSQPYLPDYLVERIFGEEAAAVKDQFLERSGGDAWQFKATYDTQLKVNRHLLQDIEEEQLTDNDRRLRDGLLDLLANVLFVQTGEDEWHPRIRMQETDSFQELDDYSQRQLSELYNHFFYERHDDFWRQEAMQKLPPVMEATDMLVCGEDLGMIPACVGPVMEELNILSLEIQRMSKNPEVRFAHPADAPYLSVCTTSTHDMPTIRGWWEEDRQTSQEFFNQELGNEGAAPYFAEPLVCRQMITQHFYSSAMWVTLPIQDLLAIDGDLRWDETHEEQINQPDNVRHKWRFRMHQSIEELLKAREFNRSLKQLVSNSGRLREI